MTPSPSPGRLTGRVAAITGASSGIGKALAERFAAEGATVVLGSRVVGDVERVAEGIRKRGGTAHAFPLDVTKRESVAAFARATEQAVGAVDLLVNNAGVGRYGFLEEADLEDFEEQIATNLLGPIYVTKAFLPLLKRSTAPSKAVLNIASVSATQTAPGLSGYNASKFGLRGFSLSIAQELSPHGIRLTVVNPGYVATAMVAGSQVPPEDMIQPEELAETCLRLATLPPSVHVDEVTVWPAKLYAEE
ncbi:MAG TPA: SDR family oxidoreductase [Candidatus Thermoplasmatota archaeon]|nr:SDR family oxidoreductase [Candidatus Thermoplasmatota archaeon]